MITEQQISEAADLDLSGYVRTTEGRCASSSAGSRFTGFKAGAKWALERQAEAIFNSLKGLGLEKHSIALNVLRIAGIKLPEPPKTEQK